MGKKLLQSTFVVLLLSSIANAQSASSGFNARLAEADRLAWLTDWYDALPIYAEVEQAATKAGNHRDAMYAKFGRLRGQMQILPLPDVSEQIATPGDVATVRAAAQRPLQSHVRDTGCSPGADRTDRPGLRAPGRFPGGHLHGRWSDGQSGGCEPGFGGSHVTGVQQPPRGDRAGNDRLIGRGEKSRAGFTTGELSGSRRVTEHDA